MFQLKMVLAIALSFLLLAGCSSAPTESTSSTNSSSAPAESASSASSSSAPAESASSASSSSAPETASSVADSTAASLDAATPAVWSVSVEAAAALYMAEYPDTVVTSIELDKSLGSYFYRVNGVDDNTEYEVSINAETGELKKGLDESLDAEDKNGVKKNQEALDLTKLLPLNEIVIAAEQAAGKGAAVDFKLEKELGIQIWEVKVQDGMTETEITLNAETGEVLQTEKD